MPLPEVLIVSLVGYLFGAVSFAVLVARAKGVDIFKEGSGNPGATNVKRTLGVKFGNAVFALDALKGFLAAGWPLFFFDNGLRLAIIGMVAAIVGHSYSVFLRFRGGKGVATTMGGLLAVMPWVLLSGIGIWLAVFYCAGRFVAVASIAFAVSLPLWAWVFHGPADPRLPVALLLGLLIVLRHRSNITRLLRGTEHSFKK